MSILTSIAVYILFWWIAFFCVLPIGIRSQSEDQTDSVAGGDPGAPVNPRIFKKAIWASLLALFFFILFDLILVFKLIEWVDFPFFKETGSYSFYQDMSLKDKG